MAQPTVPPGVPGNRPATLAEPTEPTVQINLFGSPSKLTTGQARRPKAR